MPREVLVPSEIDEEGFWSTHFPNAIETLDEEYRDYLEPSSDAPLARLFLVWAGARPVAVGRLLDLIEAEGDEGKDASWWHECYEYLAKGLRSARMEHSGLVGRRLIPDTKRRPVAVPSEGGTTVCLSPDADSAQIAVPEWFSGTFVFVDRDLSRMLLQDSPESKKWCLDTLNIASFEASELLPRAVRAICPQIYNGRLAATEERLVELWVFLRRMIDASPRRIESREFCLSSGVFLFPLRTQRLKSSRALT